MTLFQDEFAHFMQAQADAVACVSRQRRQLAAACALIEAKLRAGGRWVYLGAGTSGRLGTLDASELYPTFGWPRRRVVALCAGGRRGLWTSVEGAEDDVAAAQRDIRLKKVTARDVVVGISASGTTPYVLAGLARARKQGASTVLLTCAPRPAKRIVDITVSLNTGPEVIDGSTRLKAGTATKVALNYLSTKVMTQLGRAKGGHMTSLVASNAKLIKRAEGILVSHTGVRPSQARAALKQAHGRVDLALRRLSRVELP